MKKRILALTLALSLLLSSCSGGTKATTMHLKRAEGMVAVSDDAGKDVTPAENLGLYSGYGVDTSSESYAWINLDDVKLTKMDEDSEITITKNGKNLEIDVVSGNLFFNVTQPLADDETLDIRTSTMLVGIRGTCGWVTQDSAALLEGTVEVTAGEQSVTISAGEMAVMTAEGEIQVGPLTAIPEFIRVEIENDENTPTQGSPAGDGFSQEEDIYPLHVLTDQKFYNPDGAMIVHVEYEYDELGYETRSVNTYYSLNGYETTYISNFSHDFEAGTYVRVREDNPNTRSEGRLIPGSADRFGGTTFDERYISGNPLDRQPARERAEIKANGGRYDIPAENSYSIYSYSGDGDFPSSVTTYAMDGTINGYVEFEWAVIDP